LAERTSANAYSSSPFTQAEPLPLFPNEWPTPTERDHRSVYASDVTRAKNSRPLSEAVGMWATPTVADTEGGRANRSGRRSGELLLRGQAKAGRFHQGHTTASNGADSLPSGLILNPLFVEWLMGWPAGFTMTLSASASTGCASSEMAWFRWRRLMRSELSRLASPPAFPAQLDLFGVNP
jgi:hypothetical protein